MDFATEKMEKRAQGVGSAAQHAVDVILELFYRNRSIHFIPLLIRLPIKHWACPYLYAPESENNKFIECVL